MHSSFLGYFGMCIVNPPRKNHPLLFWKSHQETCHVLKPILFFKFLFGSPDFPKEKGRSGSHLLLDSSSTGERGVLWIYLCSFIQLYVTPFSQCCFITFFLMEPLFWEKFLCANLVFFNLPIGPFIIFLWNLHDGRYLKVGKSYVQNEEIGCFGDLK